MDPQQELFTRLVVDLTAYGKEKGIGVYDSILPPEGTPYPFIYLGDVSQEDDMGNDELIEIWEANLEEPVDGSVTVTTERQDIAAYVFRDTTKVTA